MPPIGSSFPAKTTRWRLLANRLSERLKEMPHLEEGHARLVELIAEAEALQARFELHRAGWREAAKRSEEITREGDELRSRLAGALHYQLGPKNMQLVEFGFKPRIKTGRPRKGAQSPVPDAAPKAAAEPAATEPERK